MTRWTITVDPIDPRSTRWDADTTGRRIHATSSTGETVVAEAVVDDLARLVTLQDVPNERIWPAILDWAARDLETLVRDGVRNVDDQVLVVPVSGHQARQRALDADVALPDVDAGAQIRTFDDET